jgi:hypothetical protein
VKSLAEIKSSLTHRKTQFFEKYPLKSIAIFGSYARNEQNDESDVDILVEFTGNIGINFIDLADEFESYLGLKVDLVSRKGIKEQYFETIKSDLVYV